MSKNLKAAGLPTTETVLMKCWPEYLELLATESWGFRLGLILPDSNGRWGKMYLTDLIPVDGPLAQAVD